MGFFITKTKSSLLPEKFLMFMKMEIEPEKCH